MCVPINIGFVKQLVAVVLPLDMYQVSGLSFERTPNSGASRRFSTFQTFAKRVKWDLHPICVSTGFESYKFHIQFSMYRQFFPWFSRNNMTYQERVFWIDMRLIQWELAVAPCGCCCTITIQQGRVYSVLLFFNYCFIPCCAGRETTMTNFIIIQTCIIKYRHIRKG